MRKTLLILCLLLVAPRAYAFSVGQVDMNISGLADVRYDDNVTLARDNVKDDFITSFGVGIDAVREGRTSNFLLGGSLRHNLYAENDDFNNWSSDLNARYAQELSMYDRLLLTEKYTRSDEPTSFEDAFGSRSGRYTTRRNNFGLNYVHDFTKQVNFTGRYANEYTTYSREDLAKSDLHTAGLEAGYILNSSFSTGLAYDFYVRNFRPGDNAAVHALSVPFRKYFTSQLSFDARVGMDHITAYNNDQLIKPAFYFALTNEPDESTRANVSFTKRYETTDGTQDIFGYWQVAANINRRLRERLSANAGLFYGKGEYQTLQFKDTFEGASVGLAYDVTRNSQATLGYQYSQTLSNVEFREYTRNVYSAGLRVQF